MRDASGLIALVFAGVVIMMIVLAVHRAADAARPRAPRPGDPTFRKVGPMQPRGQAALVTAGATRPGDRVMVDGDEWTVSELEPVAGDTRAWLVPGPSPDRRRLLDAEVTAVAAALTDRLNEVALEAIGTLAGERCGPEMPDIATIRVEAALRREADMVRPWLVDVGVACASDLPLDAMPTCELVGERHVRCDCAYLAHRIAERHIYR